MRVGGLTLTMGLSALLLATVTTSVGAAITQPPGSGQTARISTDGHLRVGHLETIKVKGLPGKGRVAVSFFPTAICADGCSTQSLPGGQTDVHGAAKFRVRVPGTFRDLGRHAVYYRDRERVDVELTWEGVDGSFVYASTKGEPIIVRAHGGSGG